jgi:microcystin-dependent protein
LASPFVAEIRMFCGNFAPSGWDMCNGQLLPINQNTALFSLLGTIYGGDGRTNFALPDLQGMSPMGQGDGTGLAPATLGQTGGAATVTLATSQIPAHTHRALGVAHAGSSQSPSGGTWAKEGRELYTSPTSASTAMNAGALASEGGGQPHNNLPPYLVVNFIIALQGVYPPRS